MTARSRSTSFMAKLTQSRPLDNSRPGSRTMCVPCLLRFLLVVSAVVGTAFPRSPSDGAESEGRREDDALRLALEVVERPKTNLSQTRLKLTVTNASTKSIVLDKELSAGFSLSFKTDLTDKQDPDDPIFSPEHDVEWKEIKRLPKPSQQDTMQRFMPLKPGRSLSRTYDLSQPVVHVRQGHATDKNRVHHGFYYEAEYRLQIPPRASKLFITAAYRGKIYWRAETAFKTWFGFSTRDLKMWSGSASSNTIAVEKP